MQERPRGLSALNDEGSSFRPPGGSASLEAPWGSFQSPSPWVRLAFSCTPCDIIMAHWPWASFCCLGTFLDD